MEPWNFGSIINWLERRKIRKRREVVAKALRDLNSLSVTFHGRLMLMEVCQDETNGLDPEIRRMYWVILKEAPVDQWAVWN